MTAGKERGGITKKKKTEQNRQKPRKQEQQEQTKARRIHYLCYLCLICGVILLLKDIGKVSYQHVSVFFHALLFGSAIWFGWENRKEPLGRAALIFIGLSGGYFMLRRKMLDEQFHALLLCLTKMEESTADFTLLCSGFSFLFSLFCFFLIFILKKGWLFYGITLPILFIGPMFGVYPSWLTLFLLAVFHIGDGIYHTIYVKWSDEPEKRNHQAGVFGKAVFAAAAAVLFSFGLACLIPGGERKTWMRESVQFTYTWKNTVSTGSGSQIIDAPSGRISRGNYYSSGSTQMEVSLSQKPEERIYLKSFTGGSYRGDEWAEADEQDELAWKQVELFPYGKTEDRQKVQEIRIRPLNRLQRTFFVPYLSMYASRTSDGSYCFFQYSGEDYRRYRQQLEEKSRQWIDQLEEAYQEYVNQHYLDVPREKLPRLDELCSEHPQQEPKEATAFIRRTLTEYAAYSQTPGFMPYGTDIAEYFLFDGQEGYCQHFATAAVLMYRMYGIPARYAAGYMAEPGDFSPGQDGAYHARLTDRKAHAWAEIYLDGTGWVPVEVTPASTEGTDSGAGAAGAETEETAEGTETAGTETTGSESAVKEYFPESAEEWLAEGIGNTEERTKNNDRYVLEEAGEYLEEDPEKEPGKAESALQGGKTSANDRRTIIRMLGVCAIAVLFLLVFLWICKGIKRRQWERLGADEAYVNMVNLLHRRGYLTEYDGTEPGFSDAAAKVCVQINSRRKTKKRITITREELNEIKAYAFQTAYGREICSDKERKRAVEIGLRMDQLLDKKIPPKKKRTTQGKEAQNGQYLSR